MNGTIPVATRILLSLRGDRRTLALVVVVPAFLIWLLSEVFARPEPVAPILLGVFVFFLTYILTAIGFLRERTAGTLERVLVAPVSRSGLVLGYVVGFGVLATVQSLVLLLAAVAFLDVSFANGVALFVLIELLGALTALGTGVVLSLFAQNEFQAIQFIPVVITPQVILGGTFMPVEELPTYLEYPARLMPITYLIDAMEYVVLDVGTTSEFWTAVAVLVGFVIAAIGVARFVVGRTG
ncbi:ABC transporter permease [Halapricum hydrolyticum]|uniref:ABC transporter permease n=1 Tax=Halapricum hydrolyticum TaxID=2979991 RepID=A0AAE3LEN9_9EURY|nr:ABC transporter permease [Halapricum hydrolyticum]MCU4717328.1 ABC transporter permease [Halapricum hydrolyticum]MCU4726255.1 ABC transporter permease [Halapricum hydrolyticum]